MLILFITGTAGYSESTKQSAEEGRELETNAIKNIATSISR